MRAHVRPHNGTPTLFLNGAPAYANFDLLSPFDGEYRAPSRPIARKFGRLGINLYCVDATGPEWAGPSAERPGPYDFSTVGPRLQAVLDENPDAYFLLRTNFETTGLRDNWWNNAYPDECELIAADGEDAAAIARLRDDPPAGRRMSQSFASTIWRDGVKDYIRSYIEHLREIRLYDRVIAYQIGAGVVSEWIKGYADMVPMCGDYSAPMQRVFRAWLRRKYGNYVFALRKAWDDPDVDFDTADVPAPIEQFRARAGVFRETTREQKVIDYYTCVAETSSDAMIDFCATVKDATNGDKLAGGFFGYTMELSWNLNFFGFGPNNTFAGVDDATIQRSGHLGLSRVIRSPHIDFLVSPYSYGFRGLGGDGQAMQPIDSCRLHGKLYLFEEDTLMHNNFDPDWRMQEVKHTPAIYKRNFAHCLTRGHGITWLQSSLFHEYAEIAAQSDALQKQMHAIGTWALKLERSPQHEIAVFFDDESVNYTGLRNDASLPGIFYGKTIDYPRIGAPHSVFMLRDLIEGRVPPFKLGIFLNAYRLDRMRREALAGQIRRDSRTALWLYGAGYIYDDASTYAYPPPADGPTAPLHVDNMTDLTGFRFGRSEGPWAAHIHVTDFQHPITGNIPQDLFWGTQRMLAPVFHVDDPEARLLGEVVTQMSRAQTGFALKEFADWRSIYCATPNIPPIVLRNIAKYAGVHLYSEAGDVLYATRELLGVHTVGGGPRTFSLPQPVEVVYDLFSGAVVARNTASFQIVLPAASTSLYFTGAAEKLPR
jgi:hypothetical protein